MTISKAHNGTVEIAYEVLGPSDGEPMLLITGLGGQMISWPAGFCQELIDNGFQVACLDNRDSGLSTRFTEAGKPSQLKMLLRPESQAVYRLEDMADDALAVLDALDWSSAHVLGMSEGGMIAQSLAFRYRDRVRSLTSIASAPAPRIGQAKARHLMKFIRVANPKRVKIADDLGQNLIDLNRLTGSPDYPGEEIELRELGRECFARGGMQLAAVQRQTAALAASGDRRAELGSLTVPTLVLHGEDDRLIRVGAGRATAEAIPGARLVVYPGMGHDLPRGLWSAIVSEAVATCHVQPTNR